MKVVQRYEYPVINPGDIMGFPDSSVGKESACNAGDHGSTPGWEDPLENRDRLPTPVFLGYNVQLGDCG